MSFEQFQVRANDVASYYEHESESEAARKQAFHAAVSIILDEYDIEDTDIAFEVQLDGAGDGGIDYFFAATEEQPPRIYVIQVKHVVNMPKGEQVQALVKMKNHVDLLRSKTSGADLSALNDERRLVIREFKKTAIVEYRLLLTAGAKSDVTDADLPPDWQRDLVEWAVDDLDSLTILLNRDSVALEPEVDIVFPLDQTLRVDEETKVIHGYINAYEYAKATSIHKKTAAILRMNPRLFLSAKSGFNAGMFSTLEDAVQSKNFHLFNNGITAVAKQVTATEGVGELTVKCHDFQIVNGGQTTETLWRWYEDVRTMSASEREKKGVNLDTLVPLRIVETSDLELAGHISQYNNSQNAITSADLVANSAIQSKIKKGLEGVATKPYIYEARRGTWKKLSVAKQQAYKVTEWGPAAGSFYRSIDLKVLAQALLSVSGKPEQAKEQINSWFKTTEKHEELFGIVDGGYQAALIADLYLYVSRPKLWAPQAMLDDADNRSLLSLSRFYITHLVYAHWKTGGALNDFANAELISDADSQALRGSVFVNAAPIVKRAYLAVQSIKETALDPADGIRGLTRKAVYKGQIQNMFKNLELMKDN